MRKRKEPGTRNVECLPHIDVSKPDPSIDTLRTAAWDMVRTIDSYVSSERSFQQTAELIRAIQDVQGKIKEVLGDT